MAPFSVAEATEASTPENGRTPQLLAREEAGGHPWSRPTSRNGERAIAYPTRQTGSALEAVGAAGQPSWATLGSGGTSDDNASPSGLLRGVIPVGQELLVAGLGLPS